MSLRPFILALGLIFTGCDADVSGAADGTRKAGQSCARNAQCEAGTVCLAYGDLSDGFCALDCSVSASECRGSAQCAGVGGIGIDVCQEPEKVPEANEAPAEDERPRLPCSTDADCASLDANAICAEWKGAKDCTLQCNTDDVCNPPAIAGITTTFMTCIPDEGDASRNACLPNEACFSQPMSCIDGLPGAGDLPDLPGL